MAIKCTYTIKKQRTEKAILSFVFGNDVFVSLPTGYGKSLCFGLLPCVFDALRGVEKKSIVLVVCPLVALMKEHVVHFSFMGIPAAYAVLILRFQKCPDNFLDITVFVQTHAQIVQTSK